MKIRLMGDPDEVTRTIALISGLDGLAVEEESDPYPNRGRSSHVRVYLTVRLTPGASR